MEHANVFLGAAYCCDTLTQSDTRRDFDRMRQAGLNLVRLGKNVWECWEPREGEYDFTSLHRDLTLAQKCGLQVLVEVPTGSVPGWLARKLSAEPAGFLGDPRFLQCQDRLISQLLEQCRPYSCVAGYQTGCHGDTPAGIALSARQAEQLKKGCRPGQTVTGQIPLFRGADPFSQARPLDTAGCAVYHPAGLKDTGAENSLSGDLARGVKNKDYLVLDTQCQGRPGQLPYPGQLRLWAYHHLACGAQGLVYSSWHSDPRPGCLEKGILSHDGHPNGCYEELCRIGQELSTLGEHLAGLKKQNRVAIVYSPRSEKNWPATGEKRYDDYFRWIYESFYRLNIEVDILPDTQRDFTGYELLVAPGLYCAEDNLIWAIRDYVAGGGNLIATFRSFFADEKGFVRRELQPYGMTDVFGMHYDAYTIPEETCLPEYDAAVSDWMELLKPDTAMSLAVYDSPGWRGIPAAACSRFGKGRAAYIGCYSEDGFEPILLRLLAMWHVPVPEIAWPVVQKRAVSREGKPLTFLLHYSHATRVIPSPATGWDLFAGVRREEGEPLELKPWEVLILEGNV